MTAPEGDLGTSGTPDDDDSAAQAALAAAALADGTVEDEGDNEGLDPKVKAQIEKRNRENANLRQKIKDLEPLAHKLKQIQDGEKSELTRAQEALAERESEIKNLTVSAFRRDAALSAGLTADFVEFITGETAEDCEEQAKKLAKHLKPAEQKKGPADLRQGQRGSAPSGAVDKNALIRQMAGFTP